MGRAKPETADFDLSFAPFLTQPDQKRHLLQAGMGRRGPGLTKNVTLWAGRQTSGMTWPVCRAWIWWRVFRARTSFITASTSPGLMCVM